MIAPRFGKDEVVSALRAIGGKLDRPITVFLVGGGAMAWKGRKICH